MSASASLVAAQSDRVATGQLAGIFADLVGE